jgi:integrase/recombinase XerD
MTSLARVNKNELAPYQIDPDYLIFLIQEFLNVSLESDSDHTLRAYEDELRDLGHFTMGDFSDLKLLAYKVKRIDVDLDGKKRSPRSANKKISICRRFIRFLQEKALLPTNYFDLVRGRKIDKHDSPYVALTDSEVRRMIDLPDRSTLLGSSQRMALVLSFYLGIRCSELCSIRLGDIREGVLSVRGKGNKVRTIPMPETLQDEISAYMVILATHLPVMTERTHLINSRESQGDMVDPATVWRWFKSVAKRCGVDERRVSPHGARATAITKALDNGVGIREVAILAGHRSIETTAIYDKRRGEASKVAVAAIKY